MEYTHHPGRRACQTNFIGTDFEIVQGGNRDIGPSSPFLARQGGHAGFVQIAQNRKEARQRQPLPFNSVSHGPADQNPIIGLDPEIADVSAKREILHGSHAWSYLSCLAVGGFFTSQDEIKRSVLFYGRHKRPCCSPGIRRGEAGIA